MKTNPKIHNSQLRNIGIDVGKSMLDIHIHELGEHFQAHNTPPGIKSLVSRLARFNLTWGVVEATGGYERALV